MPFRIYYSYYTATLKPKRAQKEKGHNKHCFCITLILTNENINNKKRKPGANMDAFPPIFNQISVGIV